MDWTTYQNLKLSSPFLSNFRSSVPRTQTLFVVVAEHIFPFMLPASNSTAFVTKQSYKTVLNCRFTCRAWKHGVEALLERSNTHLLSSPKNCTPDPLSHFRDEFLSLSNSGSDVHQFFNYFLPSHFYADNPFLSRAVSITVTAVSCKLEIEKIERTLERWGHHIWYVYFRLYNPDSKDGYFLFRQFMECMKNLKGLQVIVFKDNDDTDNWKKGDQIPSFPHYPHLEHVKMSNMHNAMWRKLMERNPQIARLDLVTSEQSSVPTTDLHKVVLNEKPLCNLN